jgi:hypothetical protein
VVANAQPGSTEYQTKGLLLTSTREELLKKWQVFVASEARLWATNAIVAHSSKDDEGEGQRPWTITGTTDPSLPRSVCTYPRVLGNNLQEHGRIEMPGCAPHCKSFHCIKARATGRALDIKRVEEDLTRSR